MLNYPVLITSEPQAKIITWSEDGHNAHLGPPYLNLKPNLCMEPNNNFSTFMSYLA